MIYGSVCSGIEAASVAWHPLGWKAAWLAEIEPFPSAVLAHHYPDVPNLGDMTKIAAKVLTSEVAAPDVLVGGTPCQAFSIAGLREGLNDGRGQLTIKYMELANAIDFIRLRRGEEPAIIVWENVPGVLSDKTNAFGCFLAGLAGESVELQPPGGKWSNAGCVFGPQRTVAWRVLDAQYFGVAQRRRRVFVVASAREGFDPATVLFEFEGVRRDTAPSREAGEGTAGGAGSGAAVGFQSSQSGVRLVDTHATLDANNGPRRHNGVITMAHGQGGAEIGFDRGQTLTCNHEAPIAAYPVAHVETMPCMMAGGPSDTSHSQISGQMREQYVVPVCITGDVTHTLKAEGFDASEDGTGRGQPIVVHGTQDPCTDEHLAFALGRNNGQENAIAFSCKDYGADAGPLSPTLRSMGHDGSHANAGGQVAVAMPFDTTQITSQKNYSKPNYGDPCHPLAAEAHVPAVAYSTKLHNTSSNQAGKIYKEYTVGLDVNSPPPALLTAMQVRRLIPQECELLQGFQRGYTQIPWRKKPAEECPDGPRYKALGNSMAVPCMAFIGARIDAAVNARAAAKKASA